MYICRPGTEIIIVYGKIQELILSLEENYFFTCQHNHVDFNKSFLKPNEHKKIQDSFQGKRQSERTNGKLGEKASASHITGSCAKGSGQALCASLVIYRQEGQQVA